MPERERVRKERTVPSVGRGEEMTEEYLLLLGDVIYINCCQERKAEFEKEWKVEILIACENIKKATRHCGINPCLKGVKR